ncbi:MAG: hypothetical protein ACI4I0_00425 [Acutalibacteraceae bacterium]
MSESFDTLRRQYPEFCYDGFSAEERREDILLRFDLSIPGLCEFHPQTRIITKNLDIVNSPVSDYARRMVFFIGLAEAVSYWKCACPPKFTVRCGSLSGEESAVRAALNVTRSGMTCLLSPAAPSYNKYKNFEEKGRHFKAIVRRYAEMGGESK